MGVDGTHAHAEGDYDHDHDHDDFGEYDPEHDALWQQDHIQLVSVGIDIGSKRANPLIWPVRFKEMVSPEFYKRLRLSFFRLHYQFILGGDRRASYDYVMLTCGPLPVTAWAKAPSDALACFAEDGGLRSL